MSNRVLSPKKGYILTKLGKKSIKDYMDSIQGIEDINNIVVASIKETPCFREGDRATLEEQEAFLKYMDLMNEYVKSLEQGAE